jgi:hypothetical protein
MPLFFVLLSWAARWLVHEAPWHSRPEPSARSVTSFRSSWVGAAILAALFLNTNAIHGPSAWAELTLLTRPLDVDDLHAHLRKALALRDVTTPEARIAVVWAGAQPYFLERPCVDLLGKNDPTIARAESRPIDQWSGAVMFRPGHSKWDYAYSIGALKPDVVVELWRRPEEAQPYLKGAYDVLDLGDEGMVWVRHGSPSIRWDTLDTVDTPSTGGAAYFVPHLPA